MFTVVHYWNWDIFWLLLHISTRCFNIEYAHYCTHVFIYMCSHVCSMTLVGLVRKKRANDGVLTTGFAAQFKYTAKEKNEVTGKTVKEVRYSFKRRERLEDLYIPEEVRRVYRICLIAEPPMPTSRILATPFLHCNLEKECIGYVYSQVLEHLQLYLMIRILSNSLCCFRDHF